MTEDPQVQRIYDWQKTIVDAHPSEPLSLARCQQIVDAAYDIFGLSPAPLVLRGQSDKAWAYGSLVRLSLPEWARHPVYILHESAHGLATCYGEAEPHGEYFARVFLMLLVEFLDVSMDELENSIRDYDIQLAPIRWVKMSFTFTDKLI